MKPDYDSSRNVIPSTVFFPSHRMVSGGDDDDDDVPPKW